MDKLELHGRTIEYVSQGDGIPVLLIHPSLVADALSAPLIGRPELSSSFRLIGYRRRGYGASSGLEELKPVPRATAAFTVAIVRRPNLARVFEPWGRLTARPPVTVSDLAADAAGLLRELGVVRAHVVGHSFGGVIALQLARDYPDLVRTLALLEPSLPMVRGAQADARSTVLPAVERYFRGEKESAVDWFLGHVFGDWWKSAVEQAIPGAVPHATAAADTFFRIDAPALGAWRFSAKDAAKVQAPVLSVVGARSAPSFGHGRDVLHEWFGQRVQDFNLPGANHLLQVQNSSDLATRLADFCAHHPM